MHRTAHCPSPLRALVRPLLNPLLHAAAATALAWLAALPAQAAPVSLGSSAAFNLYAQAAFDVPAVHSSATHAASEPLADYRLDSSAQSVDPRHADRHAGARAQLESDFVDTAHGSLVMSVEYVMVTDRQGSLGQDSGSRWTYRFRADEDSRLRLAYDVQEDAVLGQGLTMPGFMARLNQGTGTWMRTNTHGVLEYLLEAGETYELAVELWSGLYINYSGTVDEGMGGLFQWSIDALADPQAVPEPSTPGLLALALMVAALCSRRTRRRTCRQ